MNNNEFKRIITTFADNPNDVQYSKGSVLLQVRDELIEIELLQENMNLFVIEDGEKRAAERWIVERLARLPQLANRLIDYTNSETNFVTPQGEFLKQLEEDPDEQITEVDDALETIQQSLNKRSGLASNVLYLTSDAGEGKTTLINELAKLQAEKFKKKQTDWLVVPILLGGRPFLRFDDVVIASLVNNYRFQGFFWETFIEMVKMGSIIPAFDGFEEMFVESSTDEALSSLGNLLNQLDSSGTLLIAARKAYFDYKSFQTQAKLYDTIQTDNVCFSKISLKRWSRKQFVSYAKKRNIKNVDLLYDTIANTLGSNHPVLTRAVLVKRLLDVSDSLTLEEIKEKIGTTAKDYFSNFIEAIVEREVKDKWIDRSGTPALPLLNIEEHKILLSMIAQEMWNTNSDSIKSDVLDLLSELFSESHHKSSQIANQIKTRIKQHALLVSTGVHYKEFAFDHDEFRQFFLGRALAENIEIDEITEVRNMLRISGLAIQTVETCSGILQKNIEKIPDYIYFLQSICIKESPVSFIRENCGSIIIQLVDDLQFDKIIELENMVFPSDALSHRNINNIVFKKSTFKATDLLNCKLSNTKFSDCMIERLTIKNDHHIENVQFLNTEIESVFFNDIEIFDPKGIDLTLSSIGFTFITENEEYSKNDEAKQNEDYKPDIELLLTEKILRKFIRATQVNENIFKLRAGNENKKIFFKSVLPNLLSARIIEEVPYVGGGKQKRYKLGCQMNKVNRALKKCDGNFNKFIEYFTKG